MIQLTEEYKEVAKKYRKKFGYGVPLSMIPPTTETSDLIRNIEKCIEENSDKLLEIYSINVGENDLI